jgi:hypothetical protein
MLRALHYPSSLAASTHVRLVYASDDKIYVLKPVDDVLGMRAAATEMTSSALAAALDVPVARVALIEIPAELRRCDSQQALSSGGPHLAIEFAAQPPHGRSFDFFPTARLGSVTNLDAFIMAAAFDSWVQRRKPRQAVFVRVGAEARYRVLFINQRSSFNDGTWKLADDVTPAWYMDRQVYTQTLWRECLERAVRQIERLNSREILSIFERVSGQWTARSELLLLAEQLVSRQASLRRIIDGFAQFMKGSGTA